MGVFGCVWVGVVGDARNKDPTLRLIVKRITRLFTEAGSKVVFTLDPVLFRILANRTRRVDLASGLHSHYKRLTRRERYVSTSPCTHCVCFATGCDPIDDFRGACAVKGNVQVAGRTSSVSTTEMLSKHDVTLRNVDGSLFHVQI